MPTQEDFLAAADMFSQASGEVAGLLVGVSEIDISQVLRGGRLAQFVPDQVAASVQAAATCQQLIDDAEELCRSRAAIIAAYEVELDRYDAAVQAHDAAIAQWSNEYLDWWDDLGPYPGPPPSAPVAPVSPPAWAEVRRP